MNAVRIHITQQARVAEQLRDGPKPVSERAAAADVDLDRPSRALRNLATKLCCRNEPSEQNVRLLPEEPTRGLIGHAGHERRPARSRGRVGPNARKRRRAR